MPPSIKASAAFLTLVLAAGRRAQAVNDWSVPCTQGKCSWDLPAESGALGSLNIWGAVSAISDITPAAGWQVMTKCNMTSSNQVIQLVCKDNNPNCNQLFQGNGAVNTIVRLPQNCGPNSFARVAQHQVLQSDLDTRDNGSEAPGSVHQLTLDTDFAAADRSQGEVYFSLQGQNGQSDLNTVNRHNHRRLRPLARQSFNDSIINPVSFSGQGNLFRNGSSSIDVDADLQASVNVSVVAAGTISPQIITQLEITFGLSGNANTTLSVSGDLTGQVSSPNITLYQTSFLGFSFPGILNIRPEFTLLSNIIGNFGLKNVSATVEANYDFGGASFVFPPPAQAASNTSDITSSSGQVTFSANTDVGATLGATAHLIPQINVGLNTLDNTTSANVTLNFDASLGLQGNVSSSKKPCLTGNAEINVEVGAQGIQGSFFGIFSNSTGQSLFDKNFTLFQKCFAGNSGSSNSSSSSSATQLGPHTVLLFTCLGFVSLPSLGAPLCILLIMYSASLWGF